MKWHRIMILTVAILLSVSTAAVAGDFDWLKNLSLEAQADPSGFRARLATRFQVGDARISAVIGNLHDPADAYMVFRLGEMAQCPPEKVIDIYKKNKGQGWGVTAKNLGIKPGSEAFHALKRGHDIDDGPGKGKKASKATDKDGKKDKGRNGDGGGTKGKGKKK